MTQTTRGRWYLLTTAVVAAILARARIPEHGMVLGITRGCTDAGDLAARVDGEAE
jgi:hypothetical protein